MKKLLSNAMIIGGTVLMLASHSALGQENAGDLYRANEFSMDVFGSGSVSRYTIDHVSRSRVRQNTRLGIGAGVNYYFSKNLGIGGDAYAEDTSGSFIDSTSLNFLYRLPLGQSGFAPYAYGGGGREFGIDTWFAQVGLGMEYRFSPHIGLFIDGRGVVPKETKYYGVARLGLRFAF